MGCVDVNYKIIGLNLSMQRYKRNWTQEQLAERAGVSKQFVCNIECGRAIPSVKTILSLCDALEITPDALLCYSSAHTPDSLCTLREDHSVFTETLTDLLFPKDSQEITIDLQDLPAFDILLPDPSEEE